MRLNACSGTLTHCLARYPSGLRERSAKPPFVGSNPTRASTLSDQERVPRANGVSREATRPSKHIRGFPSTALGLRANSGLSKAQPKAPDVGTNHSYFSSQIFFLSVLKLVGMSACWSFCRCQVTSGDPSE